MDWKIKEVEEMLQDKIKEVESSMKVFSYEFEKYRGPFEVEDKFEVKGHEYWRARILGLKDELDDLREILKAINTMKLEEIKDLEALEEDFMENKFNAKYGI